eukprot:2150874-Pyramimonas_sp.AAC.1
MRTVWGLLRIRYRLYRILHRSDTDCIGSYTYPIQTVWDPYTYPMQTVWGPIEIRYRLDPILTIWYPVEIQCR